jgi:hypothetical protein
VTAILIRPDDAPTDAHRFRAVAGPRQAVGRTMGEALDALTINWPDGEAPPAAVLTQRFLPDTFFSAAQHECLQFLLAYRDALTPEERRELEGLIDAELDATVARTDGLVSSATL